MVANDKHTEGPWKWLEHETRLVSANGAGVLSPWYDTETGADGIAVEPGDARMVAAAPCMFDALRGLVTAFESFNASGEWPTACALESELEKAAAAIAKATEETEQSR